MRIDTAHLTTFAAVVGEGSFEAAARTLHLTPSAVSQRIKALETAVGQILLQRAKPCRATAAGQPLLRLAGQLALLESEALAEARGARRGQRQTRVSLVANADSLATWFLPAIAEVIRTKALVLDLHEDDQDHTADLLRDGTAMAAVTAERTAVRGCRVERLGAMRYLAVTSPDVLPAPLAAPWDSLADIPVIVFNRKDELQHRFLRALTRRSLDPPAHYVPSVVGFLDAIRHGLGWGMLPEGHLGAELAAGRCVELVPGRYLDVPLYWQCWKIESEVLAALTVAVKAGARQYLR